MQRWHDVSLHYENAWRDKITGAWVDADFHIIDNVEISKKGANAMLAPNGYSFFRWNEIVFRNFKAGNLKGLNLGVYLKLESGISKRMYRFLDKRFYHQQKRSFDLDVFAYEKIGLTRSIASDAGQLKRRLRKAIGELETIGFIKPMPEKSRFTKVGPGKWNVHFEKWKDPETGAAKDLERKDDPPSVLEGRLADYGVTPAHAKRMTRDFEPSQIEFQLECLDFIKSKGGNIPENPAGWIVKAVQENYSAPQGFKSRPQRELEAREQAEKAKLAELKKKSRQKAATASEEAAKAQAEERGRMIELYLEKLSDTERENLEKEAIASSPLSRGRLGPNVRKAILENHVEALLKKRTAPELNT